MCEAHLNSPSSAGAVWGGKWAEAGHVPSGAVCVCLHLLISWPNMLEVHQGETQVFRALETLTELPKEPSAVHVSARGVVDGEIADH